MKSKKIKIDPASFFIVFLICFVIISAILQYNMTGLSASSSYIRYIDVDCETPGNGTTSTCDGDADDAWDQTNDANDFLPSLIAGDDLTIRIKAGTDLSSMEAIGWDGSSIVLPDCTITIEPYDSGADPRFMTETMGIVKNSDSSQVNWNITSLQGYGANYPTIWYIIDIRNTSGDIVIDDFTYDGRGDGSPAHWYGGVIYLHSVIGNVEIKNSSGAGIGPTTNPDPLDSNDSIFIIAGLPDGTDMASFKFHDSICSQIHSDCIQILGQGGSPSNWTEIYNNTGSNFGENFIDLKDCTYVKIYNNNIKNDNWDAAGGASEYTELILSQVSGGGGTYEEDPDEIYIFNNFLDGNYLAQSAASDRHNAGIHIGAGAIGNHYIYNNYIKNCAPGIVLSRGTSYVWNNIMISDEALEQTEKPQFKSFIFMEEYFSAAYIYHNSLYEASGSGMTRGITVNWINGVDPSDVNSTINIRNNLIELSTSGAHVFHTPDTLNDLTIDYNRYYNTNNAKILLTATTYEDGQEPAINATSASTDWVEIAGQTNEVSGSIPWQDAANDNLSLSSSVLGVDIGAAFDLGLDPRTSLPPISVSLLSRDSLQHDRGAFVFDDVGEATSEEVILSTGSNSSLATGNTMTLER